MSIRIYINKSKAGHYKVTLRDGSRVVARSVKLSTLASARWEAAAIVKAHEKEAEKLIALSVR
jgi:hypothetical protein